MIYLANTVPVGWSREDLAGYIERATAYCLQHGVNYVLVELLDGLEQYKGLCGAKSGPDSFIYSGRFLEAVDRAGKKGINAVEEQGA